MLNLEAIEQKCLKYLMEVSNPLVPISTLMCHINDDDECRGITEEELTDFLRRHELFRVMDPALNELDQEAASLPDGMDVGLRVILVTRIPTPAEMANMISAQIKKMTEALASAKSEAANAGDAAKLRELDEVMRRAEFIAKRLEEETN